MNVALVADALCESHDPGRGHPEQPRRFRAVMEALEGADLVSKMIRLEPRDARGDDLALAHDPSYLKLAEREIHAGADQLSTGDTQVDMHSWAAMQRAVGSGLAAIDAICTGHAARAFCVVRPPGHHAGAYYGMGFCIANNIAVAARHAQKRHGVGKILIVDWDVHHGNGTQDIFYEDGSVFFCSAHQSPWYPGTGVASETGKGAGLGTNLNFPFPAGSGRGEILAALETKLLAEMEKFKPELVLISAGFDSRIDDPLGKFTLTDDDFAEMTQLVRKIADDHAEGRLVSFLEGGYSLTGLASAATAHVKALL